MSAPTEPPDDRPYTIVRRCRCGGDLQLRQPRHGGPPFLGCTNYPACRETQAYDVTVEQLSKALTTALRGMEQPKPPRKPTRRLPLGWRIIEGGRSAYRHKGC